MQVNEEDRHVDPTFYVCSARARVYVCVYVECACVRMHIGMPNRILGPNVCVCMCVCVRVYLVVVSRHRPTGLS